MFATSATYTDTFIGQTTVQLVGKIYVNLFGHGADDAGLQYWVALIDQGSISLAAAATSIAYGALGTDAGAYHAKVAAAVAFSDAVIATTGGEADYSGERAMLAASAYLRKVDDEATLKAAITPAALATTLQNLGLGDETTQASDQAEGKAFNANGFAGASMRSAAKANDAVASAQAAKVAADLKAASGNADAVLVAERAAAALSAAIMDADTALLTATTFAGRALDAAAAFTVADGSTKFVSDDTSALRMATIAATNAAEVAALSAVLGSVVAYGAAAGDAWGAATAAAQAHLLAGPRWRLPAASLPPSWRLPLPILCAGDSLVFAASASSFNGIKLSSVSATGLQDYVDAAIAGSDGGGLVWFQFQGDTYAVQNGVGAGTAYNAAQDYIEKISGVVDLGAASFSAASHTLGYVV